MSGSKHDGIPVCCPGFPVERITETTQPIDMHGSIIGPGAISVKYRCTRCKRQAGRING